MAIFDFFARWLSFTKISNKFLMLFLNLCMGWTCLSLFYLKYYRFNTENIYYTEIRPFYLLLCFTSYISTKVKLYVYFYKLLLLLTEISTSRSYAYICIYRRYKYANGYVFQNMGIWNMPIIPKHANSYAYMQLHIHRTLGITFPWVGMCLFSDIVM